MICCCIWYSFLPQSCFVPLVHFSYMLTSLIRLYKYEVFRYFFYRTSSLVAAYVLWIFLSVCDGKFRMHNFYNWFRFFILTLVFYWIRMEFKFRCKSVGFIIICVIDFLYWINRPLCSLDRNNLLLLLIRWFEFWEVQINLKRWI